MKDQVLAAFDALFEALLKRGDADEAMSLFADEDVVFWGSALKGALGRVGHLGCA